jgi:hypothetical protein
MPNCSGDQLDGLSERPWPMARSREVAHLDLGPGRATEKFEKIIATMIGAALRWT